MTVRYKYEMKCECILSPVTVLANCRWLLCHCYKSKQHIHKTLWPIGLLIIRESLWLHLKGCCLVFWVHRRPPMHK